MIPVRPQLLHEAARLLADLVGRSRPDEVGDARAFLRALDGQGSTRQGATGQARGLGVWMPPSVHAEGFPPSLLDIEPESTPMRQALAAYDARLQQRIHYEGPVYPLRLSI